MSSTANKDAYRATLAMDDHHYRTLHAESRLQERYDIALTGDEWRDCFMDITDAVLGLRSPATLIRRYSTATEVQESWRTTVRRMDVTVIYSPRDATIITVIPSSLPKAA